MKRLVVALSMAVLLMPYAVSAHGWWGDPTPHRHISGDQMGMAGLALAGVVGVVGYLVMRRKATQ
ncbi:MAG TPA: hypothetical protein VMI32_01930 [Candidatus Solibacter sp.]|nr:hypothetical protein [Candidatus Solibacter sp.]